MPPKRVVYFSDSVGFGGAEEILLQVLAGLDRHQWEPVLFYQNHLGTPALVGRVASLGIPSVVVPHMVRAKDAVKLPAFVRVIRSVQPDVFHAQLTWPLGCKFGLVAARLARVPAIIATAHSRFDVLPIEAVQPRIIATCVDRYLAVSQGVAAQLRGFGIPERKIAVVRNGIAPRPAGHADAAVRQPFVPADWPVVLTVARLEARKGLFDLIAAAAEVPDTHFAIAGDGPDRQALEARASALGVAHRIWFLGQRDDVDGLLRGCQLFVLPSWTEGLPISVLEAMRAGVPVVGTAIAGIDELVVPEQTGLLVPPKDPRELAAGIRRLLDDPVRAQAMGAAGADRAAREFSLSGMIASICRIYDELLEHAGPRPDRKPVADA